MELFKALLVPVAGLLLALALLLPKQARALAVTAAVLFGIAVFLAAAAAMD